MSEEVVFQEKKMKKTTFVFVMRIMVVCMMLVSLNVVQADDKKPVLAFLPGTLANESQAYAAKMFEKHGSEYGFEIVILDSPNADAQIQAQNVNNCIAQNVDVIAVNPNDVNAIVPSLMEAKEAGVVVCLFSSDLPEQFAEIRDIFCGVDDTMAGEVAAKAFIDKFPDGAKIVEIGGQAGHDAQIKRYQGFHKIIDNSNIEVLASQNCDSWSTNDAMTRMEDFIVKFGDEIDGVFCHWDNGAAGVIQALENADMDDVYLVAVDGCRAGFKQILDGKQDITIAQSFENIAKKTMERAKEKLQGKDVVAVNFIPLDTIGKHNIKDYEMPEW